MLSEMLATGGTVLIALGACIAVGGAVVFAAAMVDRWRAIGRERAPRGKYPRRW